MSKLYVYGTTAEPNSNVQYQVQQLYVNTGAPAVQVVFSGNIVANVGQLVSQDKGSGNYANATVVTGINGGNVLSLIYANVANVFILGSTTANVSVGNVSAVNYANVYPTISANVIAGSSWANVRYAYVNDNGVWKQFYPDSITTTTYNTPGTYTYTIPAGVHSANLTVAGAGGGAGGNDSAVGHAGYAGNVVTTTIQVTPGDVFTFIVGGGGGPGASSARGTGSGSAGVDPAGTYNGGRGGNAGGSGYSGAGGGGGAATTVRLGATQIIVAAGGGGGGGGGNGPIGLGQGATAYNSTSTGGTGTDKSGDGGGGGGGGGGYSLGGAGGATVGGDSGAYSGINGQVLAPIGANVSIGTNGGASAGIGGGDGYVILAP